MTRILIGILAVGLCANAFAQAEPAKRPGNEKPGFCKSVKDSNCGWFHGADFAEEPKEEVEKEVEKPKTPPPKAGPLDPKKTDKKVLCAQRLTWTADCGWQDPGKDWEFMKMQEEKLAQQALLNSTSAWSVKQYQLFTRWALDRVAEAAGIWEFNLTQDQDLNPKLKKTTSQMGLRWASTRESLDRKVFFEMVREDGGFLVYWTRSDCFYCEKMQKVVKEVGVKTNLTVHNASLDSKCEPMFKDRCLTAPETIEPAIQLGVKIVPDLMLYMPKENTWVRVGSGVEATETIVSRMMLYAQGVRAAAISGMKSDVKGQASVDFSKKAEQIWSDTGFRKTNVDPPSPP